MSDTIEIDGKTYIEIGYLKMANKTAKRRKEAINSLHEKLYNLDRENDELRRLLRFAIEELRYEIPEATEDRGDYCCVCMRPDWNHREGCEAVQWTKDTRSIIGML